MQLLNRVNANVRKSLFLNQYEDLVFELYQTVDITLW